MTKRRPGGAEEAVEETASETPPSETDPETKAGEELTEDSEADAPEGDAADSDDAAEAGSDEDGSAEAAENEAEVVAEDAPEDDTEVDFGDAADEIDKRVAELTTDLQRLQAEYVNYKRRVDRDRELVSQNATYKVLTPIVEVLDTIDRAREHGEVEGGFKAVADQLEKIVTNLGLKKFAEPGDVFDPNLHEALSHMGTDPEVEETSVKLVAKAGYMIGDRVVRAAQVLVVDPE
ncbi:nucleotide exchange factor GrpE [Nocardioides sp.]|uniref:nucleotide exchange factor GrpE n=1 Tax=Nocardioides sp. TaxID=35761 RepID=UPI0019B6E3ED|nr:nucleotide exchange factor GrpE [Nocardioides sp.]MBC7279698.1 nucleotide exchange factor GrpE [Nocardioides sp.]